MYALFNDEGGIDANETTIANASSTRNLDRQNLARTCGESRLLYLLRSTCLFRLRQISSTAARRGEAWCKQLVTFYRRTYAIKLPGLACRSKRESSWIFRIVCKLLHMCNGVDTSDVIFGPVTLVTRKQGNKTSQMIMDVYRG